MTSPEEERPTSPKCLDDEFDRCKFTCNAKGLTEEDIIMREAQTKEMCRLNPTLPPLWADLIWNFCKKTPHERLREIIDNKEWEGKSTKYNGKGGTIKDAGKTYDRGSEECLAEDAELTNLDRQFIRGANEE